MARYKKEQTEQIREERKDQILRAALQVFAEYGIEGTKMSMIAKAAGLSHGLIYHYFESKEEVLTECFLWATDGAEQMIEEIHSSSAAPLEKITHFTRSALTAGSHEVFRLIQSCLTYPNLDQESQKLIQRTAEKYVQLLVPIFAEGQRRGEIVEEDPDKLVNLYLTVLSGLIAENAAGLNQHLDWTIRMLLRIIKE
ncbi:hypothetical protein SY83_21070 [Paenibacillus swuensis]|uniref:HTH tetR-type domain-containing protein n=1 Tax=Paenibacillus swuensis TaxID=1178515 RepID=A0A172TMV1_9BACL|nr:TetR/AcrR family transcriptional regulator [Paenibacillus swuensis]ANE48358.1 hypothetical protein SY83_21070 [Paenibacillus swuensis]